MIDRLALRLAGLVASPLVGRVAVVEQMRGRSDIGGNRVVGSRQARFVHLFAFEPFDHLQE